MKTEQKTVPELRFPEFDQLYWVEEKISSLVEKVSKPVSVDIEKTYREIGIRSHAKGIFHKEPILGKALGGKRVFLVNTRAFVINIVFAWEQSVALTSDAEEGFIASHRFLMFLPKNSKTNLEFLLYFFKRKRGKYLLGLASPGGAGRNKTLGQNEFLNLNVLFPPIEEQKKIASFLTSIDDKLTKLPSKKELLDTYKRGLMQQLFSQQIRFKQDDGSEFPEWEYVELGSVLTYEQPTKYIVKDINYDDSFDIPVLTAGKTFVLGYTNERDGIYIPSKAVIIFDDFTTASKFVDFPFKAKSSAMKILKSINHKTEMKLIFELLQVMPYVVGEHKRHWISEFQYLEVPYPSYEEQQKIADCLSSFDAKIEAVAQQIEKLEVFKKGLLQKMFV